MLRAVTVQVLPIPPSGFNATAWRAGEEPCPPYACHWWGTIDENEAMAMQFFGQLAVSRWNGLIDGVSPVLFGAMSMGSLVRRRLCDLGTIDDPNLCRGEFVEDLTKVVWPTAVTIARIGSTFESAQAFKNLFRTWRTSPAAHAPNMRSELIYNGFGYAGADSPNFHGKLIPCDLLPGELLYKKTEPVVDARSPRGRSWVAEVVHLWATACQAFYVPDIFDKYGPDTCPPAPPGGMRRRMDKAAAAAAVGGGSGAGVGAGVGAGGGAGASVAWGPPWRWLRKVLG